MYEISAVPERPLCNTHDRGTLAVPVKHIYNTCEAHLQYMLECAVPEIQLICHLLKVMHQGPAHSNWYCGCA